jgi:hypothetical protein
VSNRRRGDSFRTFLGSLLELPAGQLWRHNQAGDLPGTGARINKRDLHALGRASRHLRGFTYTHKPVEGDTPTARKNRDAIRENNSKHFTINLSANGIEHADKLVKLRIAPVTTVVSSSENRTSFISPGGNRVTVCPATYDSDSFRDGTIRDITCATCKLCAIPDRKSIIAFPAHGSSKRRVDEAIL